MAQLVPARPHARATSGERRLFVALGRALPPDRVVYHEPLIERRYSDFVLILPSLGVLTGEVKDWRAEDILSADDEGCCWEPNAAAVPEPATQSRSAALSKGDMVSGR